MPRAVTSFSVLLLASCAAPAPVVSPSACLPVREYTGQQQDELAAELAALPTGSVLRDVANEDHQFREAMKSCLSN